MKSLLPSYWLTEDLSQLSALVPIQNIIFDELEAQEIFVSFKRDDLLGPQLGGNKFYKLHGHLRTAIRRFPGRPVASFGGAYSNHLYALAAAGKTLNIKTIGVIRGERPARLGATLTDLEAFGMTLVFLDRKTYRMRHDPDLLKLIEREQLSHVEEAKYGCYWIPEGGGGISGARGCMSIVHGALEASSKPIDYLVHACGTGTSLAGMIAARSHPKTSEKSGSVSAKLLAESPPKIIGIPVLKGLKNLVSEVRDLAGLLTDRPLEWELIDGFHCGGYAKYPAYLAEFMRRFERQTDVLLDPVYTCKVVWALVELAKQQRWSPGTHIVVVHSGGLQGRRGFKLDSHFNNNDGETVSEFVRSHVGVV